MKYSNKVLDATVLIASLGYFIDMFDFFLYNMLRVKSLTDMGFSGDTLTSAGLMISSWQMAGIFIGAILWGILGDKIGRKKGLLTSILVYSLGSLLTACVTTPEFYAAARFITAIGLAGEIGAGIALITERLTAEKRGYGVMLFLSAGFLGVISAGLCAEILPWRMNYLIGGMMGFGVLFTRMFLRESHLFLNTLAKPVTRGGFMPMLRHPQQAVYFVCGICMMMTATFVPQMMWTLSPEIGRAMGIADPIRAPTVLMIGFSCAILMDMLSQLLSEKLKSRKKATLVFLVLSLTSFAGFFLWPQHSLTSFLVFNTLLAAAHGVWMITATWAAEHFGTNIRATVATTTPSFSRAMTVVMNMAYAGLQVHGTIIAIAVIGTVIFTLALLGWCFLKETWGKDLDYVE